MALVIVGGVIAVTLIAVVGDVLGKSKQKKTAPDSPAVEDLARRVETLEKLAQDRESRIRQLESDIAFTNKLLEDKSK